MISNLFFHGAKPYAVGLIPAPWDKLVHATLFGGLAFLLRTALKRPRWWLVLAGVFLVAVADEWHQAYLPGRSADALDLAADMLGALAALGVHRLLSRGPEPA